MIVLTLLILKYNGGYWLVRSSKINLLMYKNFTTKKCSNYEKYKKSFFMSLYLKAVWGLLLVNLSLMLLVNLSLSSNNSDLNKTVRRAQIILFYFLLTTHFLQLVFQPLISMQTGFQWLELGSQVVSTTDHFQLQFIHHWTDEGWASSSNIKQY